MLWILFRSGVSPFTQGNFPIGVISIPTTYISNRTTPGLTANAINQGYITVNVAFNQGNPIVNAALAITTTQTSGVFPANTLPLFEATVDSVNLIRNLVDWRPSYI